MLGLIKPQLATLKSRARKANHWLHEIKHNGYRLIVERKGMTVWLWIRNGRDWTKRYPRIVAAALRNRCSSFVVDGETSTAARQRGRDL